MICIRVENVWTTRVGLLSLFRHRLGSSLQGAIYFFGCLDPLSCHRVSLVFILNFLIFYPMFDLTEMGCTVITGLSFFRLFLIVLVLIALFLFAFETLLILIRAPRSLKANVGLVKLIIVWYRYWLILHQLFLTSCRNMNFAALMRLIQLV